jgi:hypothetical protein
MAALAVFSQADALQTTRAYKEEVITIRITPSPTPLAMHWPMHLPGAAERAVAVAPAIAKMVADPYAGPVQVASSGTAWDVGPGLPYMLAQAVAQPTPVPVKFVAKPDPSALWLKIIPNIPANGELDVPYGTTTFPCVFKVFTFYTTTYTLVDWAYGTVASGSGSYPMENYPTTSYLSWAVPDFSATFHTYANSGPPGEKVWTGLASQSQTHCIDLKIVVPNSLPPDPNPPYYTAIAQYTLYVN